MSGAVEPIGLVPGGTGPWVDRPANEFIVQAVCGAAWNHGSPDDIPVIFGGSDGDCSIGTVGALALLVAR